MPVLRSPGWALLRLADRRSRGPRIQEPPRANGLVATSPHRTILRCALVIRMPAILAPLPNISMHVLKAKRIGGKRADRRRRTPVPPAAAAVAIWPSVADFIAPLIGRIAARTRRIFPLGFGEQSIGLPGHLREPGHIFVPRRTDS